MIIIHPPSSLDFALQAFLLFTLITKSRTTLQHALLSHARTHARSLALQTLDSPYFASYASSECTTEFVVVTTGFSPSTTGAELVLAALGPEVAVSVGADTGAEGAAEVEGAEVVLVGEVVAVRRAVYGDAEVNGETAAAAALVVAGYEKKEKSVQGNARLTRRDEGRLTFSTEASIM